MSALSSADSEFDTVGMSRSHLQFPVELLSAPPLKSGCKGFGLICALREPTLVLQNIENDRSLFQIGFKVEDKPCPKTV